MNVSVSLLLLSSVSFLCSTPESAPQTRELKRGLLLQRLNKHAIEEHKIAVGKRIKKACLVKWGIIGASLAAVGTYSLMSKKNDQPIEDIDENTSRERREFAAQKASIATAKNTKDLPNYEGLSWWIHCLFDWKLLPNTLQACIFSLIVNHGVPPVFKLLGLDEEAQAYRIPSNYDAITSFAQKVLQIQKLEQALDYYAERLSKPGVAPYQRDYYEKGLISLCNNLKDKLEMLLGYMLYKLESQSHGTMNQEAVRIVDFITEEASDFYAFLEDTLNNNENYVTQNECRELHDTIRLFCQGLEQEIGHFALLEL